MLKLKHILFATLFLMSLALVYYLYQLPKTYSDNPLVVDLLITPKELLSLDFKKDSMSSSLENHNSDHLTRYDYLPSAGLVYTKYEIFYGLNKNNFEIEKWLSKYDGTLCSNWSTLPGGVKKAFVLHTKTGQLSSIFIYEEHIILGFCFPDVGSADRSKNRKFDETGGFVISDTIKRINYTEIITINSTYGLPESSTKERRY